MLDAVARQGMVLMGCGKMGGAMLSGWLKGGLPGASVWVKDPYPADWLTDAGVHINQPLPDAPAVALIAVKPQMMGEALPEVAAPVKLPQMLADWDPGRRLLFCDEAAAGTATELPPPGPAAVLIGPEGGFSEAERNRLRTLEFCHPLALGPRILRAETAALAALTLWQSQRGDW